MKKIIFSSFLLAISSHVIAIDESDCKGRSGLAYEVASHRDRGASKEEIFMMLRSPEISDRTIHNIVNVAFQFKNFTPEKIAALEYEACQMKKRGVKAAYEWTAVSGIYEDGGKYSAASIKQEGQAIYMKFQSGILTLAVTIPTSVQDPEISFVVDGKVVLSEHSENIGNKMAIVLHSPALQEPARQFTLAMANSKTLRVLINGMPQDFSTQGARSAIIQALKDAGLVE